jgi:regulator of sigma E protease
MESLLSVTANSILAIVFILGSCIFVHELGHFVAARLAGMRVEEFMIGFPPRLFSFVRGGTRYGVGLIIFGGFCRIAGMEPGQEEVEGGFYTRPRLSQAAVLLAGATMNVLLGIGLFTFSGIWWGIPEEPVSPPTIDGLIQGDVPARQAGLRPGDAIVGLDGHRHSLEVAKVKPGSIAASLGLRPEDLIYAIDDEELATPIDLAQRIQRAEGQVTIMLDPASSTVGTTETEPKKIKATKEQLEIPDDPVTVEELEERWGVEFAPMQVYTTQVYVAKRPEQPITFTVRRQGREIDLPVTPEAKPVTTQIEDESGKGRTVHEKVGHIGVTFLFHRDHDAKRAIRLGLKSSLGVIGGVLTMLWETVTGKAEFAASGPVAIAYYAVEHARIGWDAVVQLCGLISVNLAIINLLPIPVTDGGRIILVSYEAIIRRRVSSQREMAWLVAGAVLILALFVFMTFKDVLNLAIHHAP